MADTTTAEEAEAGQPPAFRHTRGRVATANRVIVRPLAALAGGVLVFLAFPPLGVWPLAPVGAGLVVLAAHRERPRRGALLGFLAGLGLFLPLFTWVGVLGTDVWIGLASLQAAYLALLGAGLALVTRLPGWPVWSAALWVAEEALRGSFPFGGFTWGRLAFSQGHSAFTPYASLGGAPFVTFLVALTGGLAAYALLTVWRVRARPLPEVPRRGRLGVGAAALVAAIAVPSLGYAIPLPTSGERTVTVAAVQGGTPNAGLPAAGTPTEAVLRNHVEATHRLARAVRAGKVPKPDFVVWPETYAGLTPYEDAYLRTLIEGAVGDIGVPVLVGAYVRGVGPPGLRNAGIVWNPRSGPGETYVKRHLVPFGEYIPFRDVLIRYFERLEMVGPDRIPGTQPGVLPIAGTTIADTICFDVAYDHVVREAVVGGGRLITVQTNNNTYLYTGQPEQQLAIERLRAVEHGRAVVVAATSGISAVIAPDGELLEVSQPGRQQVLVERVPLRSELTLADRLGTAPVWTLAATGLVAAVVAVAGSARHRRRRQ